ncbi:MAG: hypothetical protein ACRDHO_06460 [Actinomycetota bacterium]
MRRLCIRLGAAAELVCRRIFFAVCDALETVTRTICDATQTITQTICDATQTITRTVCDATQTITETICDATQSIPIIGDLICILSHVVSTVVCVASHIVSEVVCVASHIVSTVICVASHLVTAVVCIAWRFLTGVICLLVGGITRLVCLFTRCGLGFFFTSNELNESRSECIFGWTSAYRIEEREKCEVHVILRIRLVPDTGVSAQDIANVQAVWEPGIEQAWANRFPLVRQSGDCECERYSLTVDVQWVQSGEHHTVTVHAGSGRADMLNWFVNSSGGTAAHEAGHMFGNIDEYTEPRCPDRTVTSDGSIMQDSQNGSVMARHYQGFADWLSRRTCCTYVVGAGD